MKAVWFGFGVVVLLAIGAIMVAPKKLHPGSKTANTSANSSTTNTSASMVTVADVEAHPEQYTGRHICLDGYYQSSFEFSAFGPNADLTAKTVSRPYVWAEIDPALYNLDCQTGAGNQTKCFGHITACGTFTFKAQGGLGHTGAYMYQIQGPIPTPNRNLDGS